MNMGRGVGGGAGRLGFCVESQVLWVRVGFSQFRAARISLPSGSASKVESP